MNSIREKIVIPRCSVTRWDDGLTGSALEIARTDTSPLRVLAGPGTGKTFSMMRRVARLLQEGVSPDRILVCTFTRTAATDLKKSLTKLGTPGATEVNSNTIHSYCFGLLKRASVMEITGRVPRPLLLFEERFMLADLCNNSYGGIRECGRRLKAFDSAWARLQSEDPGWPQDPIDRAFHQALISWLKLHRAMLIGELVPEALRYLRNNPEADERRAFDHVLVDEYQDLNRADQVMIDVVAEGGSLTVIGDENQSIYSFRYAYPEGVTTFQQTHPGTRDEELNDCRRCPQRIVELANSLIANNVNREDRPIRVFVGNPTGEVYIAQWSGMDDEAEGLAQYIKKKIQAGDVQPGNVLVLTQRRQFGYGIRDALNKIGVFAHSFFHEEELEGNPKKLEESQAQQAFSLLTLLANLKDPVALRSWCGFGSNSFNAGGWAMIRAHCEKTGETPWQTLEALITGRIKILHTNPIVDRFRDLQTKLRSLNGKTGSSLIEALFPERENWAKTLRVLSATLGGNEFDAFALLEHLRANITQPELPTDVDYVRVMSLHKSKGLTADMVVVAGCIEGIIPGIEDQQPVEEETRTMEEHRRLFYVALTRAKKILILSSVTQLPRKLAFKMRARLGRGGVREYAPTIMSRFISELGPSCPVPIRGEILLQNHH